MGNGALKLVNEYQLSTAERRKYESPYLELLKQGRRRGSIKDILIGSLLKDRSKLPSKVRPMSSGVARVTKSLASTTKGIRTLLSGANQADADKNYINRAETDRDIHRHRALMHSPSDAVAITGKPYHYDRDKKNAQWHLALHKEQVARWMRLLRRMKWYIEYKKTLQALFPFGNSHRRVPLERFRCLYLDNVRIVNVCRTVHVCIVLHDDYEERKFLPGLSAIIEVVATFTDTGLEVKPRLYLSVSMLRSILSETILHDVHIHMTTLTTRRVTSSDALRAIAEAVHASVIGLVKSVTVDAALGGAAPLTSTTHFGSVSSSEQSASHIAHDVVPLERSRFAVWLDRTQHGRLSISKTSSASVELLRGIRRGTRSYSILMAGINGAELTTDKVSTSDAADCKETILKDVHVGEQSFPSNPPERPSTCAPLPDRKRRASHLSGVDLIDSINSISYDVMVRYIVANLTLTCAAARPKDHVPGPSFVPPTNALQLSLNIRVVDSIASQSELHGHDLPLNSSAISASTSQKEVLHVSEHILRRFISPVRVIHPSRLTSTKTATQGFHGAIEKFTTAALESSRASFTAATLANVNVAGAIEEAKNQHAILSNRHSLQANVSIHYNEVSATLNAMLERRIRLSAETGDSCTDDSI